MMGQSSGNTVNVAWGVASAILGALILVFLLQRFGFRFVVAYGKAG